MENPFVNKINSQNSPLLSNDVTSNLQQSETNALQQQLEQSLKQEYEVVTKLGSGAYGHVWKVKDRKSNQVFALKKVFSAFQNDVDAQRTYREIVYLQKLSQHQNVVKLRKVIRANNDLDLYLLFEYMESDLFYAIKEDLLNDLHKKYIIYQLAKCLKYVHSAGLVHRDVKPSNILINPNCEIRLCDFGLSRSLWKYNNQETKLTEFIATRWYRAPEVLFGSQLYNTKSDMWSIGCLIYQLYARRPLLPGNDTVEQIQKVLEFKGFPNAEQKKSFRIPKIDEILNLFDLQKKPLNDYFKHLPCQQVKEILIHLLEYNPQKRWTADDLLNSSFLEQFRQFQSEISAEQQIKTGVNDNERKSVQTYRNVIYDQFVLKETQKCDNNKHKLQLIRDTRDSTHRETTGGKKNFGRQNSRELLTQQRKPRHLLNNKTSASLHLCKGTKNSFANTQRISHRKNMSSHTFSKFGSDIMQNYKTVPQKPVFLQMKSKKPQSKFQLSKTVNATKKSRDSNSKDKENKQKTFHYPQYLKSSVHNSMSKIPKMIQEKVNHQRNIFNKLDSQNTASTTKSSSKLSRTSMSSKQRKSPYAIQVEENTSKFESSTFSSYLVSKDLAMGRSLNANNSGKQNFGASQGGARKLKRKGIVN